jgi:hypothetical protein
MSWIRDFLRKEAADTFFGPVRPAAGAVPAAGLAGVPAAGPAAAPEAAFPAGTLVAPESAYLRLYLTAMRISATRVRGQTFYGSVASTCTIESRAGGPAELVAVRAPSALRGVDPKSLDRVVIGTVPLVDPVPYRGGDLDIEIGLFAFPATYLLGPYLDFLGEVATAASAFLPPAGALASAALLPTARKGLDLLFGAATEARLEIGLAHTWAAPVTGYHAVVHAPAPPGGFRVAADGRLVNPDGTEVRAPYLVLRLDAEAQRRNWRAIPDVADAYGRLRTVVIDGDLPATRTALELFKRVAIFSPDLLEADCRQLYATVQREVAAALPATATGALVPATPGGAWPGRSFPALADIDLYATLSTADAFDQVLPGPGEALLGVAVVGQLAGRQVEQHRAVQRGRELGGEHVQVHPAQVQPRQQDADVDLGHRRLPPGRDRLAAVEGGAGDVAVADHEPGPGPAVGDQPVQRVRAGAERRRPGQHLLLEGLLVVVEQRLEDAGPGAEPAEHGALAQLRPLRQAVHGQPVGPLLGQHPAGRGQQVQPVAGGVGPLRVRRSEHDRLIHQISVPAEY